MATGNILSAQINVTAPGAKEAFEGVAKSANSVNESLKQLGQQGVLNTKSVADAIAKLKIIISQTSNPQDLQKLNIALTALQNKARELAPTFEKIHLSSQKAASSTLQLSSSLGLIPAESAHVTHGVETLLQVFEQMKDKTGSTSAALKGLAGVVGSGLGLGLLITGITFLVEKLLETEDATKASEDALAGFETQIDNVKDSVKGLNTQLQFLNELAGVNIKITGLGDLLKLQGESVAQRQLVFDLQEQRDKLAEIGRSIVESEELNGEDLIKAQKANAEAIKSVDEELVKARQKQTIIQRQISLQRVDDQKDADEKAAKAAEAAEKKRLQRLKEALEAELKLLQRRQELANEFADIEFNRSRQGEKLRTIISNDILGIKFQIKPETDLEKARKDLEKLIADNFKRQPFGVVTPLILKLEADKKAMEKSLEQINRTISDAFSDSFANLGESIGEAISGGDISKAFQQFGKTLGGAVQAIGKQLIALGVAALLAKQALKSLFANPAIQIAAGVALVAIGAALKNLLGGGVKGFASGGYTGAGGKYQPAGIVHKGEFVFPAHAVQRFGVGYLNNLAFGSGVRGYASGGFVTGGGVGGGISIEVVGQNITRGQDIVTVYKAALRSQGRLT